MAFADKQFGDIETIKQPCGARDADSSLSSELPGLPPGMKFVGGPPPAP